MPSTFKKSPNFPSSLPKKTLFQPNPKKPSPHPFQKNNATQEIALLEAARQLGAPMDLTVDLAAAVDAWSKKIPRS